MATSNAHHLEPYDFHAFDKLKEHVGRCRFATKDIISDGLSVEISRPRKRFPSLKH